MTSFANLLLSAALLVPAIAAEYTLDDSQPDTASGEAPLLAAEGAAPAQMPVEAGLQPRRSVATPLRVLEEARRPMPQQQVRIQRRVIIRITPGSPDERARMLATLPRRPIASRYEEVEHGDCVAVEDIAGVHYLEDDRLLLFLRDREVLSADLERSCSARSFYMGFYVERSEDGKLCVSRDRLQSRSGASCQIDTLHKLVATRD